MPPAKASVLNYTLSSATLQWSAPVFDGLSDVTNYAIVVRTSNDKTIAANVSVDAGSNCVTISSLQYSTPYTFEIKAFNSVGGSPGAVFNFTISREGILHAARTCMKFYIGRFIAYIHLRACLSHIHFQNYFRLHTLKWRRSVMEKGAICMLHSRGM